MTAQPPDPSRRRFFRELASEVVGGAARVAGAVEDIRERSVAEASALFRDDGRGSPTDAVAAGASPSPNGAESPLRAQPGGGASSPAGFRTPFRFESDDVLLVSDQR